MKTEEIAILGAAGVAVWLILKGTGFKLGGTTAPATSTPRGSAGMTDWVGEIFSAAGTPYSNGWRYFENGVAISPDGTYYQGGQAVWSPPK